MESKVILYHSNKEEKCNKFILEKEYLVSSENLKDDIWLGKGMYFWDNRGNVNWWKRKQSHRNPTINYSIVAANAKLDELLDLTDFEIYRTLERLWQSICKKMKRNSDIPLGNKLNFFFEAQNFGDIYAIIKVYGKYNATPKDGLFEFNYKSMKAEPTIAVKCIYNVRNERCITEKELID